MSVENFQEVLEQIDRIGLEVQRECDRQVAQRQALMRKVYACAAGAVVIIGSLAWWATKE